MKKKKKRQQPPRCPYCKHAAVLTDSINVYQRSYGPIWICWPCRAWVGCHDGSERPLGRLANKELREWKMKAHGAFDPLWKSLEDTVGRKRARGAAYAALASVLGIPQDACHIGLFDVDLCQRVVFAIEWDLVEVFIKSEVVV